MRRSNLRVVWMLLGLVACGGSSRESSPDARTEGVAPPQAPTAKNAQEAVAPLEEPREEPGLLDRALSAPESGLSAKLVDLQLHYAGVPRRNSKAINGKGLTSWRLPPAGSMIGLSLLVEATNGSPVPLTTPTLEGTAFFETVAGGRECKLKPEQVAGGWYERSNHLSFDPTVAANGKEWVDESGRLEALWRPGETIRFAVHEPACVSLLQLDFKPTRVVIRLAIGAKSITTAADPAPRSVVVELPAEAIHGAWVVLPSGERSFVASDLVLRPTDRGVERTSLPELGLRPDVLTRQPLEETASSWASAMDELSITAAPPKLTHWADAPGLKKNSRLLELPLGFELPNAVLQARLAGEVEAARAAAAAEPTNQMLQFLLLRAEQGATSKLAFERTRLGRMPRCGELVVATTLRPAVAPTNRLELAAACASLVTVESARPVARFELQRYEVPVYATLPVGFEKRSWPIASRAVATHDPR